MEPNSEKGISTILGILLVLLVAAAAGGGVWAYYNYKIIPDLEKKSATVTVKPNSTSDDESSSGIDKKTADWKTYINEPQNYQFKYPTNYFVAEGCYDTQTYSRRVGTKDLVLVDDTDFGNTPPCESEYKITKLSVVIPSETQTFAQLRSQDSADIESTITVDGQSALKLVSTTPSMLDGSFQTTIYIIYKGKEYSIMWENSNAAGTHDSISDDILATFEFTT